MRSDHPRLTALATALAIAASITLAPAAARAACRTTTVPVPFDFDPTKNMTGCFLEGAPLFHRAQCLPYRLRAVESPRIPNAELSSSLARAFAAWTAPNAFCAPGITGVELAPTADTIIAGYTTGERGHNVVGVVDGPWPHAGGSDTLALATLTFDANTGEIYDADLEIRSDVAWSLGASPPADGVDLDAVMTHEAGHLLGLAHSQLPEAAMGASYVPGSITQRTIAPDDARGICSIYPDRQTRSAGTGLVPSTACDLSPGADAGPCGDAIISNGCSAAPSAGSSSAPGAPWLFALGAAAVIAWRARPRARAAPKV